MDPVNELLGRSRNLRGCHTPTSSLAAQKNNATNAQSTTHVRRDIVPSSVAGPDSWAPAADRRLYATDTTRSRNTLAHTTHADKHAGVTTKSCRSYSSEVSRETEVGSAPVNEFPASSSILIVMQSISTGPRLGDNQGKGAQLDTSAILQQRTEGKARRVLVQSRRSCSFGR